MHDFRFTVTNSRLRTHFNSLLQFISLFLIVSFIPAEPVTASTPKCLYISSYHKGYAWSDGVERGVRSVLNDRCEILQFDMDTKRNKSTEYKKAAALEAKTLIDLWKPDVVITADDNAAKYIIQQHYKNKEIPFVFCGVNWTTKEYGFPYRNVTGIIEVAPIRPLLEQVRALVPTTKSALYIGAKTVTERKNYARIKKAANRQAILTDSALVLTVEDWLAAYAKAQNYDFIVIGSNAGITDWNTQTVLAGIKPLTNKLSVTNHEWMMPYTMLGFTKVAEEQGELAAKAALSILSGIDITRIAIVPNRKWDMWANTGLINLTPIKLPELLLRKAKLIQ